MTRQEIFRELPGLAEEIIDLKGDVSGFLVSWDDNEVEFFEDLTLAFLTYCGARRYCSAGPFISALSGKERREIGA